MELTSLRGSDVRSEGGVWVLDLTMTKGGRPRTVPLHEHLLGQGFIEFVRQRGSGPLFYNLDATATGKTPPAELRAGYLARWVRKASGVTDLHVDPNHGW